ncbi:S-layer homology domain-containing protein [Phascolarctobacterium sp.]
MKKSLVLAMAMALGVTASAYAANPFSDVPAGHWAYDSINKLAAAGIVDGYGDSTFGGDRLMTRYEMAQIVAKAMAKGANVDRLAAEFADELDSLGVRVAALEKKSDNVKITGQIRASYKSVDGDASGSQGRLRTRLFVKGAVNEDWTYTGRFENNQYLHGGENNAYGNTGEDDVKLNWAYMSGRVGGVKLDAGRQDFTYDDTLDVRGDGAKLSYGDKIKLTGFAFKAASDDVVAGAGILGIKSDDRFYVADLGGQLGVVDANLRYFKADSVVDKEIYEVAAAIKVAKDLKLRASYFNGDAKVAGYDVDGDDSGYLIGLTYGGAKASKVGSWGAYVNYSDRPGSTYLQPTAFSGYAAYPGGSYALTAVLDGYKGFEIGANYTVAKNIVAGVKYFDFKSRDGIEGYGKVDAQTLWSEVVFTF